MCWQARLKGRRRFLGVSRRLAQMKQGKHRFWQHRGTIWADRCLEIRNQIQRPKEMRYSKQKQEEGVHDFDLPPDINPLDVDTITDQISSIKNFVRTATSVSKRVGRATAHEQRPNSTRVGSMSPMARSSLTRPSMTHCGSSANIGMMAIFFFLFFPLSLGHLDFSVTPSANTDRQDEGESKIPQPNKRSVQQKKLVG